MKEIGTYRRPYQIGVCAYVYQVFHDLNAAIWYGAHFLFVLEEICFRVCLYRGSLAALVIGHYNYFQRIPYVYAYVLLLVAFMYL